MIRKTLAISVLFGVSTLIFIQTALAQEFNQRLTNINQQWGYLELPLNDPDEAQASGEWQSIDLPHTWNNIDVVDQVPGYRRNASWYRKALQLTPEKKSRYFLYFEGANMVAEVYVNGQLAGGHTGGYVGFEVEVTGLLSAGPNEILVRIDNSYDPQLIPSHRSDFFIYGGLTRDVWLKKVNEAFISRAQIQTPSVSAEKAETSFSITIDGFQNKKGMAVKAEVTDPSGEVVYTGQAEPDKAGARLSFSLNSPQLWDVDSPNLYTAQFTLMQNGVAVDVVSEKYGYRWFEFKEHGPFHLNGKRLILRGTHRHEEMAGYGAAMPNELHRKDIEAIKEMGGNFVRLGHYPQDPEVYRACNELGVLVWDELPWCRGGVGDDVWKDNTRRLFREMITQNYNHPSIIIWSLGNEIYWLPEFEDGGNPEKINAFLFELNSIAHELDPSRKTAIRKYYEGSDIVDVFSPSIWSGWYSGTYKNYENAIARSMERYPRLLHMEYGGSSHVGRHSESPITGDGLVNPNEWEEPINQVSVANIAQNGDWSESYIVDLFDWHLHISETMEGFTGNAQWAFRDFGTPLRPENDIPYVNQKGLVDRAGNPKDAYYVFKSYWAKEPFAYIESHSWTERSGPSGLPRQICVFSNADSVEFFLSGKSLGIKVRDLAAYPANGLNWEVSFAEGANALSAVAYTSGTPSARDSMVVTYSYEKAGSPEDLYLSYQLMDNGNYLVTATARDNQQRRCLDYEERVYFQCLSGGEMIQNMGTPTGSSAIKMANGIASIEVVPAKGAEGISMTILNQDFKGSFVKIPLKTTP